MNSVSQISVCKFNGNAIIPKKGSEKAAGFDLYACLSEPITIKAGKRSLIPLGIGMELPEGYYGRIAPRSGLAVKNGIDVLAGVIDEDYLLEIKVVLLNTGDSEFIVNHGDRIAQLILERNDPFILQEVKEIGKNDRGGFGSTGIN
jgi:dUTP pyrophosphatase